MFDVILTVENAYGENTMELNSVIVIEDVPTADFSFDLNEYTATFSNSSQGATGWRPGPSE